MPPKIKRRPVVAAPRERKLGSRVPRPDQTAVTALLIATAPSASPPLTKAEQFALKAVAGGWTVEREASGNRSRAICHRDEEVVEVGWTNEKADGPIGTYRWSGGEEKIKNAASAARIVESAPGAYTPTLRVRAPRVKVATVTRKPLALRPKTLPFDPYSSTDKEIIEAVRGKKIVWTNSLDPDNPCTGRVPMPPVPGKNKKGEDVIRTDYTKIEFSHSDDTTGERILHFCDPTVGFRALFVGAIIRVGG